MDRRDFHRRLAATAAGVTGLHLMPDALSATSSEAYSPFWQQDDMMKVMTRFVDDLAQGDPKVREAIAPAKMRHIALLPIVPRIWMCCSCPAAVPARWR